VFAIADKMEDPEEIYVNEIEEESERFLEGLQTKKSLGELEKEYSRKVKEIRNIYEKSIKKELEQEAKNLEIKKANLEISEKKPYKAHCLKMEKSWSEKKKIGLISEEYKIERKIKNLIQKYFPKKIIYFFYRSKIIARNFFNKIGLYLEKIKDRIIESIEIIFSGIKKGISNITAGLKKLSNFFKKLFSFFKKNIKKQENKNLSSEEKKQEAEKNGTENK
jgi:hypothetical protein